MQFSEIKNRLLQLDTACLCDAAKQQNLTEKSFRVLDPALRPVQTGRKLVGLAYTVSCYDDFLTVIYGLQQAQPGDVLMVDGQNGRRALAGGLFTAEAARKGLAGIVIDGGCRDEADIRQVDLPVYARFRSPMAGTTNQFFSVQQPIMCGGVVVRPGQLVFGDDGIVVGETAVFAQLLPLAEAIQATEAQLSVAMAAGRSLIDMINLDAHLTKVQAGQLSQLKFEI
ncbi:MAG: RraA family protein [Chloroflexota bacterium]